MVRNYIRKTDRGLTYSKDQLREAVEKVRSGELNGYEAAVRYKIPRTTVYDHVIGRSGKSLTLGKPPVLSSEVEKILAENLKNLQDNGFNLGRKDVLELVGAYLNSNNVRNPFKSGKPGDCWLVAFCKRHDFNAKPLYKEFGATYVNKEKDVIIVKEFYSLLEMRIDKLELVDKPGQIWHIEEHSFYKGKGVANDDRQKDMTCVTAFNAVGKKAPLLTVTKGQESHDWMLGKHINVNHTRGMCAEVFKNYFETVFLNYIDDSRPNLVILEAQSLLIDLDLVAEATKAKVTMVKCPSYLEGLDIPIARTLKQRFTTFKGSNKEFANFIADVFDGVQVSEIQEDFKNAGIHPFATVPDDKFDDNQLRVYEDYKAFKDRHFNSSEVNDPEEVIVKEDIEFQENFVMELDDISMSMSMTGEEESPSTCGEKMLRNALISVKKGLTIMEASSSINDEADQTHAGAREIDTNTEENQLVSCIMDLNNAGFSITEENVAEAVHSLEGATFKETTASFSYEDFMNRHPTLNAKLKQNQPSGNVTAESVRVWLVCVKRYLKKINLEDVLNCPKRILNFGEAGFCLKHESLQENDKTEHDVNVLVTSSADGNMQSPSVIFPFKLPNGFSSSWTKADILYDHITDIFYPWLIEHNVKFPVILFMNRSTHINLSLWKFFKEKQIIPIALLNTEIQPLGPVFRSLKLYWEQNNSTIQGLKKEVLAKELESYINRDYRKEMTDSFKACGIYPFNPNIKYINELDRRIEKRRIEDSEKQTHEKNPVNLLKEVEKRIVKEVLEEFMKSGDSWTGDPVNTSLFYFWKGIKEEYSKEEEMEITIEKCVTLNVDGDIFEVFIDDAAAQLLEAVEVRGRGASLKTQKCCASGCSNNELGHPGKVFYVFPEDPGARIRWLQQIHRPDLTEKISTGATSDLRVCSDHFTPCQYTVRGTLIKDALPNPMQPVAKEPAVTQLKRKPTEQVVTASKKRPRIIDEPSGLQASTEELIYIENHDIETQCQDPLAIKLEPGVQHVATQTFSRKEVYLSVACITGPEQIDLPQVFSEQAPPISRTIHTQTTVNLITCYITPVKRELQAELRYVQKKIKMASDVHMDGTRFAQCCENYLNDKIAKIVKSHSNIQEKYVGNRYGLEFKAFAHNLYMSNSQSYRFIEKIFNLPSRATLRRLQLPARTGINQNLIEYLKVKVSNMPEKEKICAICFDVMRISNNLWYEVHNDFLCGMHEIDQVMGAEPAKYAAILTLRGLYTKWKQPVSFAFMTEKKHYPELKEWLHKIIGTLFDIGLNIKAFVADLDNEFMDVSVTSDNEHHFEIDGRRIYRFYDVRYLFKSVRDAFMEYKLHFGEKVAQWKHILKVYNKDKNNDFSLMPKITNDHVRPRGEVLDDVNLAIEVFSKPVAAAMNFHVIAKMADHKIKETVEFVDNMSKLYDLLNSKTLSTAYRGTEQQNRVISDLLNYLGLMEVIDKNMRYTEFKFVTGLIVNIKSVVSLLDDLKSENILYLMTKCLSKESAEEFFGDVRRLGGNCCERPTAIMFTRSFRRMFLTNLVNKGGENVQDLKSTLYKIGEYDIGKKDEPECENLRISGIGDFKIQWPSNEYIAGYILFKCLEKHKCAKFIEKLSGLYDIPVDSEAATLFKNFKKYNAENINSVTLLKPPEYLVHFVDHLDAKYSEYYTSPSRGPDNFGWNMYRLVEEDSFELPCECFPLKYMKILFIRLKIEHCIREHNRLSKNARKPRYQQAKMPTRKSK